MIKTILKYIVPAPLYSFLQKKFRGQHVYKPQWNTLTYAPLTDFKIFFDPKGAWQKKMLTDTYDTFLLHRLKEMDLTGKVIYDIGSHVGFYSFYLSRLVGKAGEIHAFEPNHYNADRIRLICAKNKDTQNIHVHEVALSDNLGEIDFVINTDIESGRSSGSFTAQADTIWPKEVFEHRGFVHITAKTVPLDLADAELGVKRKPDILKIDVEGAEYFVLKGAEKLISQCKPLLLMEIHSIKSMHDALSFLYPHGYKTEVIYQEPDGRCFIMANV